MRETTHLSKLNTHFSEMGIETAFLRAHLMKKTDPASHSAVGRRPMTKISTTIITITRVAQI
jgi:hypothetical protein